jgi:hypothetical protein
MSPFDDLIHSEICFPGAVSGSTESDCPHCGELLTVPVDDPIGEESSPRAGPEIKAQTLQTAKEPHVV